MTLKVEQVSETTVIIRLGNKIDLALVPQLSALCERIRQHFGRGVVELIPAYTSVLVEVNVRLLSPDRLKMWVMNQGESLRVTDAAVGGKHVTLPVYYHPSVGPDLAAVAEFAGVSEQEVIERHSQRTYTVCAIGFAPGFAFLASVDETIAMPRHTTPRHQIPAGSVGIAQQQTAVYPAASPAGWQIIGNCPKVLFDPRQSPMMPFDVGDTVRFEPMSESDYRAVGGQWWQD